MGNFRGFLSFAASLVLSLTCTVRNAFCQDSIRPNVVIILVDDLGYGELGCYGGRDVATPHIDSLAIDGIRFTHGYVTAPFCAASRAAILTGRYQTRFGFEFNPIGAQNALPSVGLPLQERTFADSLRESGYATGLVGKWHQGGTAQFHPQRRGFDEFFGFLHEGHYYVPTPWEGHLTWLRRKQLPDSSQGRWTSPSGSTIWSTHLKSMEPAYDADNPILRSSQPIDERSNLTEAFTREAEHFIARHASQPFCLLLAYNAVHSPMQASTKALQQVSHIADIHRRIFAAMLLQLDEGVGRVLACLKDHHLDENTIVFFLSDNGGPTRELTSSNHPLRGEKGQLFEGGIRVPFLVRWTGRLPRHQEDSRMVSSMDIAATALALANPTDTQPPGDRPIDGKNLLPYLTKNRTAVIHERLYWRVGQQAALRQADWKLLRNRGPANRQANEWQLYNLQSDPSESTNIAATQPDTVQQLLEQFQSIDRSMSPPLWTP